MENGLKIKKNTEMKIKLKESKVWEKKVLGCILIKINEVSWKSVLKSIQTGGKYYPTIKR